MKVRAEWRAPRNLLGESSEEIERKLLRYLRQYPGLEALQDHYGVQSSEFWIDDRHIAPYGKQTSGDVLVSIEGELEERFDPEIIASWSADRIWEELADYSDLLGFPERFQIRVSELP